MKLIADLDKTAFQAYTIQHGIERVRVKVPLREAHDFEVAIQNAIQNFASKSDLVYILKSFGGSLRSDKDSS